MYNYGSYLFSVWLYEQQTRDIESATFHINKTDMICIYNRTQVSQLQSDITRIEMYHLNDAWKLVMLKKDAELEQLHAVNEEKRKWEVKKEDWASSKMQLRGNWGEQRSRWNAHIIIKDVYCPNHLMNFQVTLDQ